uniref:Uncharacterized protein n=1 Tax=Anser brachyrhynchus TaxID=132585 RepID=A0A8B9C492_9AVES
MSKFKLPSFSWSPKKEAIAPSEAEGHLEESNVSISSGDTESKLTLIIPENQHLHMELDTATEKDGEKGKNKKSQFIMPKISLSKAKGQKVQVSLPILETDVCDPKQEKDGDVSVQESEKESSGERAEMGVKMPKVRVPTLEFSKSDVKAPKIEVDVSPKTVSEPMTEEDTESPEEKEVKLKEHEIKAEEAQTEEQQGWFKMPKFRIPAFGRTSLKEKKGDADVERSLEKTQAVAEITIGKEGIQKSGESVKGSGVSLPKMEGDISLSAERTDSRVNIPKTETYADIVKRGAEGQKMHASEFIVSSTELSKPEVSASKIDRDSSSPSKLPICTLSLQEHKVKSQDTEIPKVEMINTGKIKTDGPEVNIKIPKLKIPRFTFKALPTEADVSVKILTLTEPDIKTAQMTATIDASLPNVGQDIHWSYVEGQEVSEIVEPEHVAIERCEIYTTEIVKESEILSSEVKTATLGFSLLKVKLPESHSDLEVLVQQPSSVEDASMKCSGESFGADVQRPCSAEIKPCDKPHSETEESSRVIGLPKLKTFTVEVKPSGKPEESHPDKSPEEITAAPLSKDEDAAEALEDEEKYITNEKEKTDSKRSPGRFKFWLPSIGFSSSGDETSSDSKTEVKKIEEMKPEDMKPSDTSVSDSSKQTEKTGWFRFPKLGFSSPSKKAKTVDKEEIGHKERRISDEDSPSDKPEVFFDAQETLSPKEATEGEKAEIDGTSSNVPVSRTIVTSSARTELILLEEEKDSQSNISGDTTK